jgi:TPR repeat protein
LNIAPLAMKRTLVALALMFVANLAAMPARADFESGLEAYTVGSFEQAAREWAPLAEKGDAAAQYHLGLLYEEGQGLKQDYDLARFWYLRAAQKGYVDAYFALGEIYALGRGTQADRSLAYHWYTMAAGSGHARAKEIMGRYAPKLSTEQMAEAGRITHAWKQVHVQ